MTKTDERIARLEVKVDEIKETISSIETNFKENAKHVAILNDELGQVNVKMKDANKLQWFIFTTLVGVILSTLYIILR